MWSLSLLSLLYWSLTIGQRTSDVSTSGEPGACRDGHIEPVINIVMHLQDQLNLAVEQTGPCLPLKEHLDQLAAHLNSTDTMYRGQMRGLTRQAACLRGKMNGFRNQLVLLDGKVNTQNTGIEGLRDELILLYGGLANDTLLFKHQMDQALIHVAESGQIQQQEFRLLMGQLESQLNFSTDNFQNHLDLVNEKVEHQEEDYHVLNGKVIDMEQWMNNTNAMVRCEINNVTRQVHKQEVRLQSLKDHFDRRFNITTSLIQDNITDVRNKVKDNRDQLHALGVHMEDQINIMNTLFQDHMTNSSSEFETCLTRFQNLSADVDNQIHGVVHELQGHINQTGVQAGIQREATLAMVEDLTDHINSSNSVLKARIDEVEKRVEAQNGSLRALSDQHRTQYNLTKALETEVSHIGGLVQDQILNLADLSERTEHRINDTHMGVQGQINHINEQIEALLKRLQTMSSQLERLESQANTANIIMKSMVLGPVQVRLVNGSAVQLKQGRVEILHNGQWGTICDDLFDNTTALVFCRTLGYTSSAYYTSDDRFGSGTGPIWLDDVTCTGQETDASYCRFKGWARHNCDHSEDVSIFCD